MKLEPSQVKEKSVPLSSRRLLAMVDAPKGVAGIIETCAVHGTIEGEVVDRCLTGGLIDRCEEEGTIMIMRGARPGAMAAIALSGERADAAALYMDRALPLIRS